MIAARVGVDLGRAAELGGDQHEDLVEQAARAEVGDERGESLIDRGDLAAQAALDLLVMVPPADPDRDVARAGRHEPARQEQALARLGAAVAIAHLPGLGTDVEGRAGLGGVQQLVGALVEGAHRGGPVGPAGLLREALVHHLAQLPAPRVAALVHVRLRLEVPHAVATVGGVRAQGEGGEAGGEVALASEGVGRVRDADVRRERALAPELLRHDASHARIDERLARRVPREHRVRSSLVSRLAVAHGAHDAELVRDPGEAPEMPRELQPVDLRTDGAHRAAVSSGRVGLGVEGLLVSEAARQVQVDDTLRARRRRHRTNGRASAEREEVGETEAGEEPDPHGLAPVRAEVVHDVLAAKDRRESSIDGERQGRAPRGRPSAPAFAAAPRTGATGEPALLRIRRSAPSSAKAMAREAKDCGHGEWPERAEGPPRRGSRLLTCQRSTPRPPRWSVSGRYGVMAGGPIRVSRPGGGPARGPSARASALLHPGAPRIRPPRSASMSSPPRGRAKP